MGLSLDGTRIRDDIHVLDLTRLGSGTSWIRRADADSLDRPRAGGQSVMANRGSASRR